MEKDKNIGEIIIGDIKKYVDKSTEKLPEIERKILDIEKTIKISKRIASYEDTSHMSGIQVYKRIYDAMFSDGVKMPDTKDEALDILRRVIIELIKIKEDILKTNLKG